MCGWQVKLCHPLLTRAIPERLRDEQLIIKRYTNKASFTFYLSETASLVHVGRKPRKDQKMAVKTKSCQNYVSAKESQLT